MLGEFARVKAALLANSMDDDTFDAAKETCLVLGGKLSEVRTRQLLCYSNSRDLEAEINQTIMKLSFDRQDFASLDLQQVRSNTPLRELSPTPLDRVRSREPSPFKMPPLKLTPGTTTPSGSQPDPHAYFSRPDSSQSIYGARGAKLDADSFRAAMEAKQMEDESPPQRRGSRPTQQAQLAKSASGNNIVLRSASGVVLCRSDGTEAGTSGSMFDSERPSSAMSEASMDIPDLATQSRPPSRLGDDVSSGRFDPFSEITASFEPVGTAPSKTEQQDMRLNEDKDRYVEEEERKKEAEKAEKIAGEKRKAEEEAEEERKRVEFKRKEEEEQKKEEELRLAKEKKLAEEKAEAEEKRKRLELEEEEKKKAEELRIKNEKKLVEEKAEKL